MKVLVIAEHDNKKLKASTLHAVTAATVICEDIDILVAGFNCGSVAIEASGIPGISKVLKADAKSLEHFLPENMVPLVSGLASNYTHVLAPAAVFGKTILPGAAALHGCSQISNVSRIIGPDVFEHPVYAGNAIETAASRQKIHFLTIMTNAFELAAGAGGNAEIVDIGAPEDSGLSKFISEEPNTSKRPELTEAKIVVTGGRGIGSKENFSLVYELADMLGAAVGTTRAAVDEGFAPNELQIGQSGKTISPELYLGAGVSGTIQHVAGIRDSRVIVAINNDPNAPIFEVADYGLVADTLDALRTFMNILRNG
jgi:electron transfer flavoprotein alpha subunit